ncbi:MAG: hypothetical protein KatS3mg043_0991 [Rhodothermaceae bacterium]|nr:MAG: hypothetical protein KatS3mg043_0991 [Rhodothermaceae bacterium]
MHGTAPLVSGLRSFLAAWIVVTGWVVGGKQGQAQALEYGLIVEGVGAYEDGLPFWLHANRQGLLGRGTGTMPSGLARLHARYATAPGPRLRFDAGAELAARAGGTGETLHFHRLYGQARYGAFTLTAGRLPHTAGLVDSTLSLGSMVLSPNATPVPAVSLAFDYIPILVLPGKTELIHAKGYFSHGWLEGDRFVRGAFLHGKYLYLRGLGPADFPVLAYAGINHYVIWGGTHPDLGRLPSGFRDFVDVVLARAGDRGRAPGGEVVNALGNTVASYDFGLTVRLPRLHLTAYRQFFIDTSTAARFRNPWDGLWGLSLQWPGRDRLIRKLLWEHVSSKRQGSRYDAGEPDGADNYYNNFLYRGGWTYYGRTLGLPLFFPDPAGERPGVVNNIVVAHHLGLEGRIARRFAYRSLFTYSRNYGARDNCGDDGCFGEPTLLTPRRDQVSWLFELRGPLSPTLDLLAAVAVDAGDVYPTRAGLLLGLSWRPGPPQAR